ERFDVPVDLREAATHARFGRLDGRLEVPGEEGMPPDEASQPSGHRYAEVREHPEIEPLAAVRSGQREAERALRVAFVRHVVERLVEVAREREPVPDVFAAVAPGHARMSPDGDRHVATGAPEFRCELLRAGAGADDEHPARR